MKRWKFKMLVGALLVSLLSALAAFGGFGAAHAADGGYAPLTIKISTANGEKDVKTVAARKMKEELEARSGGKITVEVYPSGQLLNDTGMVDGVPNGTTDIGICGLGWWSGLVPEISTLGLGMFDSADDYWATCEGGLFDLLFKKFDQNADTRVLEWMYCGASECILTKTKAVHSPDDLKGLKMRIPNNAMAAAMEGMGASPVTIPVADVYTSLQTGVVEGTIGTLGNTDSNSFWDVVNYITQYPVSYSDAFGIIVSNKTFNGWPEQVQKLVQEISHEMYPFSKQYIAETNDEIWARLEARNDLTIHHVPASEMAPFVEAIKVKQVELLKRTVPADSFDAIMTLIDKYSKK